MHHTLDRGPRKTRMNKCNDSSPRHSVRTIMPLLFMVRNFLGFYLTSEHNASYNTQCLEESVFFLGKDIPFILNKQIFF